MRRVFITSCKWLVNINKIVFYYGVGDQWNVESCYGDMAARYSGKGVNLFKRNIPHAFVECSSNFMAESYLWLNMFNRPMILYTQAGARRPMKDHAHHTQSSIQYLHTGLIQNLKSEDVGTQNNTLDHFIILEESCCKHSAKPLANANVWGVLKSAILLTWQL